MQTIQPQVPPAAPFTMERKVGKTPGTVIFRLSGPFTARSMYGTLTPDDLHKLMSFQSMPNEEKPTLNILDITEVPYMDSSGLGRIVSHLVHCNGKGIRMVVAGVTPRVLDLLKMTKTDTVIPMAATADEAEIQ